MRKFVVVVLALLSFSVMFVTALPLFDARVSTARAHPAVPRADTIVQPPCGEAEFNTAFNTVNSGGGTLTFNCGTATIAFSSQKTVEANVTIDGGGTITLSAENTRLFAVAALQALTLNNLTLTRGYTYGGAVTISDTGALIADHVTFANMSDNNEGAAIFGQGNAVITLTNTLVRNNTSYAYGALSSNGPVWISDSVFESNAAKLGGGALKVGGNVNITNTQFISNSTIDPDTKGGGIYATNTAYITLTNVSVQGSAAPSGAGGGLMNEGIATLMNVTLSGNSAIWGGGIKNDGIANLIDVTLNGNWAGAGGGGGIFNSGTLTLTDVTLNSNSVPTYTIGGGLMNKGTVTLIDGTLSNNWAGGSGGIENFRGATAILTGVTLSGNRATHNDGGGIRNLGTVTLTNVTLSNNSAAWGGGGLSNGGLARLTNVTIYGNWGGGISVYGSAGYTATMTLKNTIIANSTQVGNCDRGNDSFSYLSSSGFNLSTDKSCAAYFIKTGDQNNLNTQLSGLANFGGSTLTHMPLRGSPAIDRGQCSPGSDQRGKLRPVGSACDIGAVERQPGDWNGYMYLPLTLKK
jgi:predicted outer membrane repeat protein